LDHGENPAEKRMYSSENSSRCPVRSLKALIERTDPSATHILITSHAQNKTNIL
jgi:hypothetical protein